MRFTSLILAGVFAIAASAQSTSATTTTSAVASATTTDAAQASITNCLNHCGADDTTCRANCITVPAPSNQQANDTINCVADCPKGNGTAADNTAYGTCVNNCIAQYFYTSTGAPAGASATGSSGSGSGSGSSGSGSSASGTSGSSASGTSSSSSSTSTSKSNAAALQMGASAVGLVGFLAAFLAL